MTQFLDCEERTIKCAEYILKNKTTIRATANHFGIPKSTVHLDLSKRLRYFNSTLYHQVKQLLQNNFEIKHIHGGESTKLKYQKLKLNIQKFDELEITDNQS